MTELHEKERRLIANRWQCPDGTILESKHRHDYVQHLDKVTGNVYALDGGLNYIRYTPGMIDVSVYTDSPHELQREFFTWGTRGQHGKQKLKRVALRDMSTEHIKNVLLNCSSYLDEHIIEVFKTELEYRKGENND